MEVGNQTYEAGVELRRVLLQALSMTTGSTGPTRQNHEAVLVNATTFLTGNPEVVLGQKSASGKSAQTSSNPAMDDRAVPGRCSAIGK